MSNNYKNNLKRRINTGLTSEDLEDKIIQNSLYTQWKNCANKSISTIPPLTISSKKKTIQYWISGIAATILLAITLTYTLFSNPSSTPKELLCVSSKQDPIKHILPDSSIVWLLPNSKVSYYTPFNTRDIQLDGKATFDVTPNKNSPFRVLSTKSIVEVVGTTFSVDNSKQENIIHLYTGKINLNFNNNIIAVQPNEKVILDTENLQYSVEKDNTIQWNKNQYRFKAITLNNLILFINQNYNYDIMIQNPDSSSLLFTGAIFYDETIDEIIQKISFILNLKSKKVSETKFILK